MKPVQQQSRSLTCMLIILPLVLAACSGATTKAAPTPTAVPPATLTASGSGSTTLVLESLADAYRKQHKDLVFSFPSGSDTGGGVKGALQGQFDLAAMARLPKDTESAAGLVYLSFGTDKTVVATSSDISLAGLTGQQVKDIFMGKITNWLAVGGPDATISVFVREEEETNTQVMRKGLLGDGPFAAGSVGMTSESDLQAAMSRATKAIGYLTYSGVQLKNLKVHTLAIDGQDPANVSHRYPYTRPLGVGYLPGNVAKVRPFLDFITGPEGQTLLAKYGLGLAK